MDEELMKLCKEVYKRTGWENTYSAYEKRKITSLGNGSGGSSKWEELHGLTDFQWEDRKHLFWDLVPLYTSDYLLEKLATFAIDYNVELYYSVTQKYWKALLVHSGSPSYADTPLKALLKLTLALDDAKELTHDSN